MGWGIYKSLNHAITISGQTDKKGVLGETKMAA